jgi:hypothetical protein
MDNFDRFDKQVKGAFIGTVIVNIVILAIVIAGIAFLVSNCSEIAHGVGGVAGEIESGYESAK